MRLNIPTGVRWLWLAGYLACLDLEAQPFRATHIFKSPTNIALKWQGGMGPFLVETSHNLRDWSDQGDLGADTNRALSAFSSRAFYRLRDLDPNNEVGSFFGLIQTEQGEFGDLMARHRLKSRWSFYLPKGTPATIPANFFRNLIVFYQFHENGRVFTLAGTLPSFATVLTPGNAKQITATWSRGSGAGRRDYTLTMDFPYGVTTNRATPPLLSDPTYALVCVYATNQPLLNWTNPLASTNRDAIGLVQLAPGDEGSLHDHRYTVSQKGVSIDLAFREGNFLRQGNPMFILKTMILHEWTAPSVLSGSPLPNFRTDSYFSRTLKPGHHNFTEVVLIEPALDPALSEASRAALLAANIRFIYAFKDLAIGISPDDIRFIGFDMTTRPP